MSWTGIFFSGNQERKNEIATLSGELFTLLDNCFVATNKLIDCIQKYLPGRKFDKLERDSSRSIRDNCDQIIQRLGELEMYLEQQKKDVEKQMNPELYKNLVSTGTSYKEKMKIAKMSSTTIIKTAGSVEGVFLCGAINTVNVFENISKSLGVLKTCVVPTVSSGGFPSIWTRLWGMFSSLFAVATERDQQEDALDDYRSVVQEFHPTVGAFSDNISLVKATIELTV